MNIWAFIIGMIFLGLAIVFLLIGYAGTKDSSINIRAITKSAVFLGLSLVFLMGGNLLDADMHGFSTWPLGPM